MPGMSFNPTITTESRGDTKIWWFPPQFSQSELGDKSSGSNACTLIALLVAHACQRNNKIFNINDTISQVTVDALAESILLGNEIYKNTLENGNLDHLDLSVPEAITAAGPALRFISEWKSLVYLQDLRDSLFDSLSESLGEWYLQCPADKGSDLFVLLIAENRSVLLVIQRDINRITLVDSHRHQGKGAVIAQVSFESLFSLCSWYNFIMETHYGARPQYYELNLLYFKGQESSA